MESQTPRETGQTNPQTPNPASISEAAQAAPRPKRIPMSVPRQRLETAEIPGYRLYWFKEDNVPKALDAYYEFVDRKEINLNRIAIGGHPGVSGNTDLGSRVSLVGGTDEHGNPQRLILMKLKMEFFKEDQMAIVQKNAAMMEAIFDQEKILGEGGSINDSGALTYVDQSRTEFRPGSATGPIMNRPIRKAKIGRAARR